MRGKVAVTGDARGIVREARSGSKPRRPLHLFRDCAVTELVECAPEEIGIAPDPFWGTPTCRPPASTTSRHGARRRTASCRLTFLGIRLHTVSTSEVTAMHVGKLGAMAQMYLKDLAEKTRWGQLGRARKGRIPGGRAHGCDVLPADATKEPPSMRGRRVRSRWLRGARTHLYRTFIAWTQPDRLGFLGAEQTCRT
jgi:hypothetical protein